MKNAQGKKENKIIDKKVQALSSLISQLIIPYSKDIENISVLHYHLMKSIGRLFISNLYESI